VRRYRNPITNFVYRMLNDYDRAVDLAQETFVRVYMSSERYQANYSFSTYIYRIAVEPGDQRSASAQAPSSGTDAVVLLG
jgi:DNA-directed RNA polymerase specialized sigma24 family protein